MITANLFNIQHFSLEDGPGIRTVVFFKGCPLDCVWCHNPESKSGATELFYYDKKCTLCGACKNACPNGAHTVCDGRHTLDRSKCISCGRCVNVCANMALETVGRKWTVDEIMEDIERDGLFFGDNGGVTFSGGEPFAQFEALCELLKRCKQRGYSTCIETSGYTDGQKLLKAAEYTDLFLYDCKETDAKRHQKYVGGKNERILENLSLLDKASCKVVLRCPIIPHINDRLDHITAIAALAEKHSCIKEIELMPYHPLGLSKAKQLGKLPQYSESDFLEKEEKEKWLSVIRQHTAVPVR